MHSPIPRQSFDHLEELEFVISLNTLISQAIFVKLPNSVEQSAFESQRPPATDIMPLLA